MESADAQNSSKKKVSELLVRDLKSELEKRGLDKNGVKTALIERLSKALQDEGKNPDEYLFDVSSSGDKAASKTPPVKRSNRKTKESDSEMAEDDDEEKQEEEEQKADGKEDDKDVEKAESKEVDNAESTTEVETNTHCNGNESEDASKTDVMVNSPPGPENAPVVAPLTVEDVIKLDTSSKTKPSDNDSMFVNPDDTQSDMDSSVNEKESQDENVAEGAVQNAEENHKDDSVKENLESTKEDSTNLTADSNSNKNTSESANTTGNSTSETPSATAKPKSKEKEGKNQSSEKADSVTRVAASSKNLWVSGLAEKTRANDLKNLFSKYGKVSGAKIVTNARTPGACCYGFITMSSSDEASLCIEKLNQTEFHGRMITVEQTNREPTGTIKRAELKAYQSKTGGKKADKKSGVTAANEVKKKSVDKLSSPAKSETSKSEKTKTDKSKSTDKKTDKPKDKAEKSDKDKAEKSDKDKTEKKSADDAPGEEKDKDESEVAKDNDAEPKKERKRRASSRDRSRDRERRRARRSRSRERIGFRRGTFYRRGFRGGFGYRPFFNRNMVDRRDHLRLRDRDSDMDRRFSEIRQREIERKNREESIRLERERERLRIEREKLERERAEVLRLEREKQRMERERLEREKAELRKRTQMTLEDRRGYKRGFDSLRKDDFYLDERKHMRRESSLEPPSKGFDFGRNRGAFPDRRGDRFEGRGKGGDISPTFGRREGRHEPDFPPRNNRELDRGREEWKGKGGRDRGFDRPSFNERGARNFDRPHPWDGGQPNRDADVPPMGNTQWPPVMKNDSWGHVEQNPTERWGPMEHSRGQPNLNMPPPNSNVFGNAPGGDIMAPMPGHFPADRFNSNMMRRF